MIDTDTETHDYEPGEETSPMATDPNCRICGRTKKDCTRVKRVSDRRQP
jgi:hypothetical protein